MSRIHAVLLLWPVVESVLDTGHTVLAANSLDSRPLQVGALLLECVHLDSDKVLSGRKRMSP